MRLDCACEAVLWLCLLGQPREERLQHVCCCGCCASQEWVNLSAVPVIPWAFFPPPCSCLASRGFKAQCAQWETVRQLAKSAGYPAGRGAWVPSWWLREESACSEGDLGSIPGLGRSPGGRHGNPCQYLAWRIPMDRGAWQAAVHGVTKSQTWLRTKHSTEQHRGAWGSNGWKTPVASIQHMVPGGCKSSPCGPLWKTGRQWTGHWTAVKRCYRWGVPVCQTRWHRLLLAPWGEFSWLLWSWIQIVSTRCSAGELCAEMLGRTRATYIDVRARTLWP